MKKTIYLFLSLVVLGLYACDDEDTDTTTKPGTLDIEFNNTINGEGITMDTKTYTNAGKEGFIVSELKYIVSNIVLIKKDGGEVAYPVADSYFVIDENDSKRILLKDIQAGEYTKVKFGIGVDQSKYPLNGVANFIPTAEEKGMLWSWSAGYKFLKFEGTFSTETIEDEKFVMHIGTHGTTQDNYKEVTLDLPSVLTIGEDVSPSLEVEADILKVFDGTNTIELSTKSDIQVDPVNAPKIAENLTAMFEAVNISN